MSSITTTQGCELSSAFDKHPGFHLLMSKIIGLTLFIATLMPTLPLHALPEYDEIVSVEPKYQLVFEGNHNLSEARLKKAAKEELTSFEQHGYRRSDIDDAAFQMEMACRNEGYAFAKVDYRFQTDLDPVRVTFLISEGQRIGIDRIRFVGNTAFDDKTLLAFFKNQRNGVFGQSTLLFVSAEIQGAYTQIRDYYLANGFLDAEISSPQVTFSDDGASATIEISINEGPKYIISEIKVVGDLLPETKSDLEKIRNELIGQPYVRRQKNILSSRLVNSYQNLGYAYATVTTSEQSGEIRGDIYLTASVRSGPLVSIAAVRVQGNADTKEAFILNRLRLKPGDRYSASKKRESFRELYKTALFAKVDLSLELQDDGTSTVLVVEVVEIPSVEFYFEPGWGSYEQLRLKAGLRERSLFGTGIILNPEATVSTKAHNFTLRLTDPWFLNTSLTADAPVYYSYREEPSFTREDLGLGVFLSKDLTEHWTTSAGYNLRNTDISDLDPETEAESLKSDYDLGSLGAQVTYDTRDDIFFPLRGNRFFFAVDYADKFLGGDIAFTRLTGGARYFLQMRAGTVLGFRYTSGFLIPGPEEVGLPIAERFFNGGGNTVRSYEESELGPKNASGDPVGGYGYNVFNLELRQRIYGKFFGTLFFDAGNIAPNQSRSEQELASYKSRSDLLSDTLADFFSDFHTGVGLGLQYLLPIGPLRADFAFNPNPDEERDEDAFVFHFSVGTAF
jgi:outer membrane protein assembly complex protein YaeT